MERLKKTHHRVQNKPSLLASRLQLYLAVNLLLILKYVVKISVFRKLIVYDAYIKSFISCICKA